MNRRRTVKKSQTPDSRIHMFILSATHIINKLVKQKHVTAAQIQILKHILPGLELSIAFIASGSSKRYGKQIVSNRDAVMPYSLKADCIFDMTAAMRKSHKQPRVFQIQGVACGENGLHKFFIFAICFAVIL